MFRFSLLILVWLSCIHISEAQLALFDNSEAVKNVKLGAEKIYWLDTDSSDYYIGEVEKMLPGHPVVPLMKAMTILWLNIPVLDDPTFKKFTLELEKVISICEEMDSDNPEAIFFEMSAHGLLAEYYADRDFYMSAVGEASQAYSLLKKGFNHVEELPEFLFVIGIYNYFRETYPERHPVIKPFMWLFRDGDSELGLEQLERATRTSVITNVEAYVYLSYIYLRYEEKPAKAREFLQELKKLYPENPYVITKSLEGFNTKGSEHLMSSDDIQKLINSDRLYYKMIGNVFMGIVAEKVEQNTDEAFNKYSQAIGMGEAIPNWGSHYKSLAYLGAARILVDRGDRELAKSYLKSAGEYADIKELRDEIKQILN